MSEYNLRIRIISDDKHIDKIVNARIWVVNSAFDILQKLIAIFSIIITIYVSS